MLLVKSLPFVCVKIDAGKMIFLAVRRYRKINFSTYPVERFWHFWDPKKIRSWENSPDIDFRRMLS